MNKKELLVSIIMTSYNYAAWIEESITSVLNQTYDNFELIIVDDGSSDNSIEIIERLANQDDRISFFQFRENKGAVAATNYGLSKANGKFIAIINSDDIWCREKLAKQVELLEEKDDLAAVFSLVSFIDENGNTVQGNKFDVFNVENRPRHEWLNFFFKRGNCLCHPSVLFRKKVYDSVGFYDERLRNLPDFHMWVRVCLKYDIHIMKEPLVKFRIHQRNESSPSNILTQIRTNTELMAIYAEFSNIHDIDELKKIFPEHAHEMILSDNKLIPFYLANIALKQNVRHADIWGIRELYRILRDDFIRNLLSDSKMLTNRDFYNLVSEKNICGLNSEQVGLIASKDLIKFYSKEIIKILKIAFGCKVKRLLSTIQSNLKLLVRSRKPKN